MKEFDFFALALDESNDVHDTAQLLIFVRGRGLLPDPNPRVPKYCRVSGRVSG